MQRVNKKCFFCGWVGDCAGENQRNSDDKRLAYFTTIWQQKIPKKNEREKKRPK